MFFDNWEVETCLAASSAQELNRLSSMVFPAAIAAIADAVNGLTAVQIDNYLDFMTPWFLVRAQDGSMQVSQPAEMRNRAVAVMSGCGLCVEAVWRCLGITCTDPTDGTDILRRMYEYKMPTRPGAIYEVMYTAKAAAKTDNLALVQANTRSAVASTGAVNGAVFTPAELVALGQPLLCIGDAVIVENPEHVFTVVDQPVPVDRGGATFYNMRCLHGGRKTSSRRQQLELADTELSLENGQFHYVSTYEGKQYIEFGNTRPVSHICRTAYIPRKLQALLPSNWRDRLPPEPVEATPEAPPVPDAGTLAARMLSSAAGMNLGGQRQFGAGPAFMDLGGGNLVPIVNGRTGGMWSR